MTSPSSGPPGQQFPYGQQNPQSQQQTPYGQQTPQSIPGYTSASSAYSQYDRRYQSQPPSQFQNWNANYQSFQNRQYIPTFSNAPTYGPLTPPSETPSPFPGYAGRARAGSQSSSSDFMSDVGSRDEYRAELAQQRGLMQPPGDFSSYGGQGSYFTTTGEGPASVSAGPQQDYFDISPGGLYGRQGPGSTRGSVDLPSPGTGGPKHSKRRQSQGAERQSKHWKGGRGRETEETYVLTPRPREGRMPEPLPGSEPLITLQEDEYKDVFQQLNDCVCRTTYDWLAHYKFRIPVSKSMKKHKQPEDRELTEYVQIVKKLIEGREVPNHAVRDERIKEVISIMEGAAEVRHVIVHVSREQKPDRRVLGFIAAVAEYCWILGDDRGAIEISNLYATIEEKTQMRKKQAESGRVHSTTRSPDYPGRISPPRTRS